jgi:hypothetical protein
VDHNTEKLNRIIDTLKAKSHLEFVWSEFDLNDNSYNIYEYIMLTYPKTEDWFYKNLNHGGMYDITDKNPNNYRLQSIQTITTPRHNYLIKIKIN